MKKQGLIVTPKELWDLCWKLFGEENSGWNVKFQINIINKKPNCSDTWEIEK